MAAAASRCSNLAAVRRSLGDRGGAGRPRGRPVGAQGPVRTALKSRPAGQRPAGGAIGRAKARAAGQSKPSGGGNALGNVQIGQSCARPVRAWKREPVAAAVVCTAGGGGVVAAAARSGAAAAAVAVAVVVAAADDDQTSCSSTTSFFSAVSTNGIGYYRFSYNGSNRAYVGVIAQEVQQVMPKAVVRGQNGYLRVFYKKLGIKFQTYEQWIASGARVPTLSLFRTDNSALTLIEDAMNKALLSLMSAALLCAAASIAAPSKLSRRQTRPPAHLSARPRRVIGKPS